MAQIISFSLAAIVVVSFVVLLIIGGVNFVKGMTEVLKVIMKMIIPLFTPGNKVL